VKAVLEYIDSHYSEKITLLTLSRVTGLAPNHFQETFKRIVGVSPKALCDAKRLRHFKQLLRNGKTISAAIYGAGFESSRAVYEKSSSRIGMTPSTYRRGGEGATVRYAITDAKLGRLLVARTERGICALLIGSDDKLLVGELQGELPKALLVREKTTPRQRIAAAQSCQSEDPLIAKLPDPLRKHVFEVKMWKALCE
jgi:AraC family transcriptional regulator of adaptative response/methylated-DNA-[protein]-cysteine methyltransferase